MTTQNIKKYSKELKNKSIILCSSIILLFILLIATQEYLYSLNTGLDSLINISGRQRMLSQRLALFKSHKDVDFEKSMKLFESSQAYLREKASKRIKEYYNTKLDSSFNQYIKALKDSDTKTTELLDHSKKILKELDHAVTLFENESNNNEKNLFKSNVLLSLLLITIVIFLYFNFLKKLRYRIVNTLKDYEKEKNKAYEASQTKTLFLANMSHELRTPLNGIINLSYNLQETSLDKVQQEYLNTIISAGNILSALINDILDITKLQSNKVNVNNENFSLTSLMNEVESILQPKALQKGLYLKYEKDISTPENIHSDALRIKQLLLNIINNALKFSDEGGVTVKSYENDSILYFEIIDSGMGISEVDIDRIFTNFTQLENTYNKSQEGSGLGLSISKKIIESLNGEISVTSTVGDGSCFRIKIPLLPLILEQASMNEPKKLQRFEGKINRILLVEDNKINQLVMKNLLEKQVIEFDLAENGKQAIDLTKSNFYDLILMDISMPVMDGFEATKEIRSFNTEIPIFCLSANVFEEDQKKALESGMNEFLQKPLKPELFIEYLNKYFK